jgi:hypothetical protein
VVVEGPFCHFDIPAISQIYVLFRGRLAPPYTFAARQPESLEARLFAPDHIPWDSLAFSSVAIALERWEGAAALQRVREASPAPRLLSPAVARHDPATRHRLVEGLRSPHTHRSGPAPPPHPAATWQTCAAGAGRCTTV